MEGTWKGPIYVRRELRSVNLVRDTMLSTWVSSISSSIMLLVNKSKRNFTEFVIAGLQKEKLSRCRVYPLNQGNSHLDDLRNPLSSTGSNPKRNAILFLANRVFLKKNGRADGAVKISRKNSLRLKVQNQRFWRHTRSGRGLHESLYLYTSE